MLCVTVVGPRCDKAPTQLVQVTLVFNSSNVLPLNAARQSKEQKKNLMVLYYPCVKFNSL